MNQAKRQLFEMNKAGVAPAAGQLNTDIDAAQQPLGGYSNLENVRIRDNGLEMRGGLVCHNQTAEASSMMQLHSYKCDIDGTVKFLAQLSDGDVLAADTNPPTADANDFGDIVMDYSALKGNADGTVIPGSFSKSDSALIHSNGAMQHVIWPGSYGRPILAIFRTSGSAVPRIPTGGIDVTDIVADFENTDETATLTYTIANHDGLFVCCEYPASSFTIDMGSVVADGSTTCKVQYVGSSGFTDATTGTDGTSGLQQDGTITFTKGATEYPTFAFGQTGFWYRIYLSAGDATETVRFKEISYNGDWKAMVEVPHYFPIDIIEAQVEQADGTYQTYSASAVTLGAVATGDYCYFATTDNIWAIYVDVGGTPNTTASTVTTMEKWNQASGWAAVTSLVDGTNGLANSGFMSWNRLADRTDVNQQAFNSNLNHLYWWRMKWDDVISDDCIIALSSIGQFDISRFGVAGRTSCVWKTRGCYTFGKFARDIYVSAANRINILNGPDTAILTPGDGRRNPVVAMGNFHNELMVWQQELGTEGGTLTIFEGYSPATFGKLILSVKVGTFSQKSKVIIDGSLITTSRDSIAQTVAFFISHYGVFMTDGRVVRLISQEIQNFFDPTDSQCITLGQEDKMWIGFDSAKKCLRMGLVCGSGATKPNIFPVFDLNTGLWSLDTFPTGADGTGIYPLCFTEVEGASGSVFSLQYLGCHYGRAYRSNNSVFYDAAVTTKVAVTAKARMEFSNGGNFLEFRELVVRAGVNSDYQLTKKVYEHGVIDSNETETYSMTDLDGGSSGSVFRERLLQRNYAIAQMSVELSWKDVKATLPSSNPAPKIYDYVYEVYAESNQG